MENERPVRQRWLRIGILTAVLFGISVAGRLVGLIWFDDDFVAENQPGPATVGAVGLVMAVMAIVWGRLRQLGVVVADLAGAAVGAGALHLLVGPFVSGTTPAAVGMAGSFTAAWLYAGFAAGGAVVGLLLLIMVGRDYRSVSLKRFAEARMVKPSRPVRR